MAKHTIMTNRAPVLTLWAAVVAERLGFDRDAALSLGKAMAGLTAQSKGRHLGIYKPAKRAGDEPAKKAGLGEEFWVDLCGRPIPAKRTNSGVRAVVRDKPVDPDAAARYLEQKLGDALHSVREAMTELAKAFDRGELADRAFALYEQFRPAIPEGRRGWGAQGQLDLDLIRSLSRRGTSSARKG